MPLDWFDNRLTPAPQWPWGAGYSRFFAPNRYLRSPLFEEYRVPRPSLLLLPPSYFDVPVMPIPDVLYFSPYRSFPPSGVGPRTSEENPLWLTGVISQILERMLG